MTKQELALEVIDRLKKEYPDADCTLDYDNAWKLLVSVRLAAQCTDARVNVVVQDLYAKYPTVEALANADVADIEAIVHPCGLGKSKARDISACMKISKVIFNEDCFKSIKTLNNYLIKKKEEECYYGNRSNVRRIKRKGTERPQHLAGTDGHQKGRTAACRFLRKVPGARISDL